MAGTERQRRRVVPPGARLAGVVLAVALAWLSVERGIAAPAAAADREIRGLLAALQSSPCRFQRNGTWYSGREAEAHLQRKYAALRSRDLVDSAEQFIARGASRSSVSGSAYRVACPGRPEQEAAAWFEQQLAALRRHAAPPPARVE